METNLKDWMFLIRCLSCGASHLQRSLSSSEMRSYHEWTWAGGSDSWDDCEHALTFLSSCCWKWIRDDWPLNSCEHFYIFVNSVLGCSNLRYWKYVQMLGRACLSIFRNCCEYLQASLNICGRLWSCLSSCEHLCTGSSICKHFWTFTFAKMCDYLWQIPRMCAYL